MFIDDSSQVGVDQDGVWGFHIYLALSAFQLPCDKIKANSWSDKLSNAGTNKKKTTIKNTQN